MLVAIGREDILVLREEYDKARTRNQVDIELVPKIISQENVFNALYDVHVLKLGHAGAEKMHKMIMAKYSNVSRRLCEIFYRCCSVCLLNKRCPGKAESIRPIISKTFNSRGQVDLIDMQSTPIRGYKWILQYQDHLTKFCYLRALTSKTATCVAEALLEIFLLQGCPGILQSDNGREFCNAVIRELMILWPDAKIVNGRPRHPQSQGSVERSNQDIEIMLGAWMLDFVTNDWVKALPFIAHKKNCRHHKGVEATPYELQYGSICRIGLNDAILPSWFWDNSVVRKEEELEKIMGLDHLMVYDNDNASETYDNVCLLYTSPSPRD